MPTSDRTARTIRQVAEAISGADALLITAGAGMSADSGLPVFRGNEGFWRTYPGLAAQRISFERMAQPYWFAARPRMAWAFYGHRLQLYRAAGPHAGYAILRRWSERMAGGSFVVTSNVDGQFCKAGFARDAVAECHGSIHRLQCLTPCTEETWEAPDHDLAIDLDALEARGKLPHCPQCGAVARPNILMFNDGVWVEDPTRVQMRRFDAWLAGVRGRRLVVLEIGAGTAIPTIRRIGERAAERSRTLLVRINPESRESEEGATVLPLPALQALEQIDAAMAPRHRQRGAPADAASSATDRGGRLDSGLATLPSREMPCVDMPVAAAPAQATHLDTVHFVDLRNGGVATIDPHIITPAEIELCIAYWYANAGKGFVPLPALRGIEHTGYTMRGQVIDSPPWRVGGTPGAALLEIRDSRQRDVVAVGFGRRTLEGAYLWRRLHEGAKTPVQAVEYPMEPWIARRLEPGAARNCAVLGSLALIECAMAVAWLVQQQRRDQAERR